MKTSFFKLLFSTIAMLFLGSIVVDFYGVDPLSAIQFYCVATMVLVVVRLSAMIHNRNNVTNFERNLVLDLAVEFWDNVIAENLYKGYQWLMRAKQRNANVLIGQGGARIVHIPQAGAVPNVVRNRKNYPIPRVKRNDLDLTYTMDELSSDSTVVFEAEKWELSYAKIPDALKDHINEIGKKGALTALYRWAGKNAGESNLTQTVVTTGANFTSSSYYSTMTGNRKTPLVADITTAKALMNTNTKKDSNPGKRVIFMDENMYTLLKSDAVLADDKTYKKLGAEFKDGDLVKIEGYEIIRTDVMPRFTAANVAQDLLDPDYAEATDQNPGMIMVDFDFVHVANNSPKMFYKADDVDMQADIMNALAFFGASRERKDDAGVVIIVADA
jgi:hypothetical protein